MKASKAGVKKPAPSDSGASVDQSPRLPWTSRLWASVGLPWIVTGILTYTILTLAGQQFLHNPRALDVLREKVPASVYDRSTSIFLTALAIDLLNILFERQTIKVDCVLLPAFIKGMASTTNVLVRFFVPVMALTEAGRPVVVQRYICWMHTTPSILMLLKMISTTITTREVLTAIVFDEIMVVTGVAALVTTGWQRVLWSIVTHVAMLPVVPYMHKAFTECMAAHRLSKQAPLWSAADTRARGVVARAMEQVRTRPLQLTMLLIYVLNLILWCTFAVTWDLALLGWISVLTEEVLYLCCDFSAKVLFSSTLMLSSFKEFEARRESAMRVIENSSKAKLITELQALLEQKERFMSSVSHELRTPLNGIIGISEGMLSGCCGVLPEGVRRQIYIIRTSGARLLALINDVMDAAALRQNKLVLKQEQVVLRHVVDDVLDLTRSLVDSEVTLVNLVPPRMLVMGDTGRIVQVLNNLLGNAAKFTRRGQIRVTARQVEGGRKVAVTVSDTGIGIPRNKLATIFLPFEQVDMSISRKYGGFGLGLNIVQELVKAHGGTINVSSIEGKGSAFTFTLPLARAMGRESLEEAKAAAQRNSIVSTQDGSNTGGKTSGSGSAIARGASGTASGTTPRLGDGGGDDSSTVVSSSDASRRPARTADAATSGAPESELEQYGELMYNAAELSALASSRPYAQSVRDSMPASLEGGNSPATLSALVGGPIQGGSHPAAGTTARPGKVAAAAAAAAPGAGADDGPARTSGGGSGSVVEPAVAVPAQGSDAKIIHGPRPFHFTMYKRFLLLSVDDDPVNQSVVKSLLGSTGYEVVAVPSGAEALRYVATSVALPDLVLLDCMMPEMDGYEVLQRLRAMTPNVHVPIIMVSAQTEEEHVVCGLDLGADDYVTKPFKRQELLARIRAQLAYGEWEHDDGALETISSMVAADFHSGGPGGVPHAISGELESGNAEAAAVVAAAGAGSLAGGAAAAAAAAAASPQARISLAGASGSIADQRLIVCIDDDDVNQVVLQGMLTSQHYRYVRASTGAQGLSFVCGTHNGGIPPDLVLLDCSLPDMTGFDVCRCIRQMYNKQQVPIIMLSARHNESAVVEGLKCGANSYVTKPFRRNELLARIRLHLRSRDPVPGLAPSRADSVGEDADPRVGGGGGVGGGGSVSTAGEASLTSSAQSKPQLVQSQRLQGLTHAPAIAAASASTPGQGGGHPAGGSFVPLAAFQGGTLAHGITSGVGGGSPLSTLPAGMLPGEVAQLTSASNSVAGVNASLGLYGYGVSRAASRAFSHTHNGPDSEALNRLAHTYQSPTQLPPQMQQMQQQLLQLQPPARPASSATHTHSALGTSSAAVGSASQGSAAAGSVGNNGLGPAAGGGGGGGNGVNVGILGGGGGAGGLTSLPGGGGTSTSLSQQYGPGSPTGFANPRESASGGPCITFSLQAAAAAIATATSAAGIAGSSGHFNSSPEAMLLGHGLVQSGVGIGAGGGGGNSSGNSISAAGLPGTSFLYGGGQRPPMGAGAGGGGAGGAGAAAGLILGGGGNNVNSVSAQLPPLVLDADITAAEPQIRALRNELAAMRMQLEALQSGSGRDPFAALLASPGAAQKHQQQLLLQQASSVGLNQPGMATPAAAGAPAAAAAQPQLSARQPGPVGHVASAAGTPPASRVTSQQQGQQKQWSQQQQQHHHHHQQHLQEADSPFPTGPGISGAASANTYQAQDEQQQQLQLQPAQQLHHSVESNPRGAGASQQQGASSPTAAATVTAASPPPPESSAASTDGRGSVQQQAGAQGQGAGPEKSSKKGSKLARLFGRGKSSSSGK